MIILLDLNYTLIENSLTKKSPFIRQIEGEVYRQWLIDLVKDEFVILITARPPKYREATLKSIETKTAWHPQAVYFNTANLRPPQSKELALKTEIFPKHGQDAEYLAIESNPRTRFMYRKHNIPSIFVEENIQWTVLPSVTTPTVSGNSMTL